MIGKTLGHYQITNQLGKAGMGEVLKSRDTRLGCIVAIKSRGTPATRAVEMTMSL